MKRFLGIFFIIIIIFPFYQCNAQQYKFHTSSKAAIRHFERATHFYDAKQHEESIAELENALKEDAQFIEASTLLADVYADKKLHEQAVNQYKNSIRIDPEFFPQNFLNLAKSEMQIDQYDSAKAHIEIFLSYKTKSMALREKAVQLKKICDFAAYAVKHPVDFNPLNLGESINTADDEYLPALTADDATLVYTRRRLMGTNPQGKKDYNEDFYISKKANGKWQTATNMGAPINTNGNEGAHCISPDGMAVYFTACNRQNTRGCDLYYSKRTGGRWSPPVNMGSKVNSESWDSQPTISSDGNTIYFLSSRPGGAGRQDIWKTSKDKNGQWMQAENLGAPINTDANELSPFIHPDNQTFYFASDGHPGMGGTDIYFSRLGTDGKWQMPVNIGYPINTSADESSLFVNAEGNTAFFASDRFKDGKGRLDICSFELYQQARPTPVSYVKGMVKDRHANVPLEAEFNMIDIESGNVIVSSVSDNETGEFLVCIPSGKNYALNVSKPGYLFYSEHFSNKDTSHSRQAYNMDVLLSPVKAGEKVVLKNTFYETNSFDLKPTSYAELNKVIAFLKANEKIKIEVAGHTDNTGDEKSNNVLSERRAKSVLDYLIKGGADATKLAYKGYGENKPVGANDTEEGRAKNRRTELTIISTN